jgi:protein-tyrosine kinase
MSRVFDALNRASEEKKELVQTSDTPITVCEDKTAVPEDSDWNGSWASARLPHTDPTSNVEFPPHLEHCDVWPRSWRERLEHILFGWHIRRFKSHPLIALDKDSPAAEQYKILREQLKKLRIDSGVRCVSVTSPVQRDGKTTVAVNLAVAMALDYEGKVLLIDCDLRRPEVHRYFGIDPSPGLADYLVSAGNGNPTSCIRDTFIPGFQIVPGGKPTTLSSELLAKEKMTALMKEIRVRFPEHQIILDAPPALSTPDPLVLGRHVDGILMVVRAGKTPRDYLAKAVQSLNSDKILGIVLNGVNLWSSANHYYYSYRSSTNA